MSDSAQVIHDALLADMPEGASHDEADCPICTPQEAVPHSEAAEQTEPEGGNSSMSDNASHQQLEKALREKADQVVKLERAQAEFAEMERDLAALEQANAVLKAEVKQLNDELDQAQVAFKEAKDQIKSLREEITKRDEAAQIQERVAARSEQVSSMGLFTKEYIEEKAAAWAALSDEEWAGRLEEWSKLRPTTTGDAASAMTGTSEALTDSAADGKSLTATQRVLGLA